MDNLKYTQESADTFAAFCSAVIQYAKALGRMQLVAALEIKDAYAWAKKVHPQWMGVLLHTKKHRTKKKYHTRIIKEWREYYAGLRPHPQL